MGRQNPLGDKYISTPTPSGWQIVPFHVATSCERSVWEKLKTRVTILFETICRCMRERQPEKSWKILLSIAKRVSLGTLNMGLNVFAQSSQFGIDPGFLVDTLQLIVSYSEPNASA